MSTSLKALLGAATISLAILPQVAAADEGHHHGGTIAKNHAPIGVMGDHMHKKGEVMFSYRAMRMHMEDNRIGTDGVSPTQIATSVPNRFFGAPMQPPTLRVVPTQMDMDMHMLGVMYGVTDWLTVMAMGQYVTKEMDHTTFQGGMGPNILGEFTTQSDGFGDTKLSALIRAFEVKRENGVRHNAHFNAGISIPTGSITETDQILTPMGMTPSPRLPYPMQLGSGTVDIEPGVTYNGVSDSFSWGAQYRATLRTGNNDEGYTLGDKQFVTAWAQYGMADWVSFSARAAFSAQEAISGNDAAIAAPVQTANPDFQGGDRLDIGVGINFAGQSGVVKGHRLALEVLFPVHQDLNGPQLETDWTVTIGWQRAFK